MSLQIKILLAQVDIVRVQKGILVKTWLRANYVHLGECFFKIFGSSTVILGKFLVGEVLRKQMPCFFFPFKCQKYQRIQGHVLPSDTCQSE